MSFGPLPELPLDDKHAQPWEEDLELKAEEYASTHPDGSDDEPKPRRHLVARFLQAFRRGRS